MQYSRFVCQPADALSLVTIVSPSGQCQVWLLTFLFKKKTLIVNLQNKNNVFIEVLKISLRLIWAGSCILLHRRPNLWMRDTSKGKRKLSLCVRACISAIKHARCRNNPSGVVSVVPDWWCVLLMCFEWKLPVDRASLLSLKVDKNRSPRWRTRGDLVSWGCLPKKC